MDSSKYVKVEHLLLHRLVIVNAQWGIRFGDEAEFSAGLRPVRAEQQSAIQVLSLPGLVRKAETQQSLLGLQRLVELSLRCHLFFRPARVRVALEVGNVEYARLTVLLLELLCSLLRQRRTDDLQLSHIRASYSVLRLVQKHKVVLREETAQQREVLARCRSVIDHCLPQFAVLGKELGLKKKQPPRSPVHRSFQLPCASSIGRPRGGAKKPPLECVVSDHHLAGGCLPHRRLCKNGTQRHVTEPETRYWLGSLARQSGCPESALTAKRSLTGGTLPEGELLRLYRRALLQVGIHFTLLLHPSSS
eukprot:Hpha_TRINITY_DN22811_c0_g1::TRINITY_DN22811_c0_g1_i1::g.84430::m.84430